MMKTKSRRVGYYVLRDLRHNQFMARYDCHHCGDLPTYRVDGFDLDDDFVLSLRVCDDCADRYR